MKVMTYKQKTKLTKAENASSNVDNDIKAASIEARQNEKEETTTNGRRWKTKQLREHAVFARMYGRVSDPMFISIENAAVFG